MASDPNQTTTTSEPISVALRTEAVCLVHPDEQLRKRLLRLAAIAAAMEELLNDIAEDARLRAREAADQHAWVKAARCGDVVVLRGLFEDQNIVTVD